jgi:hypothetical protein
MENGVSSSRAAGRHRGVKGEFTDGGLIELDADFTADRTDMVTIAGSVAGDPSALAASRFLRRRMRDVVGPQMMAQ